MHFGSEIEQLFQSVFSHTQNTLLYEGTDLSKTKRVPLDEKDDSNKNLLYLKNKLGWL